MIFVRVLELIEGFVSMTSLGQLWMEKDFENEKSEISEELV